MLPIVYAPVVSLLSMLVPTSQCRVNSHRPLSHDDGNMVIASDRHSRALNVSESKKYHSLKLPICNWLVCSLYVLLGLDGRSLAWLGLADEKLSEILKLFAHRNGRLEHSRL